LWELAFTNMAMREDADGQFSESELKVITQVDVVAAVQQLQQGQVPAPRGIGFVRPRDTHTE
jgi:hypothetical protein